MEHMFIDAHLHLQDTRLGAFREDVIHRAMASGVDLMVCNSVHQGDWQTVRDIAEKFSCVVPCYGVHPWYADSVKDGWLEQLEIVLKNGEAVGEIGLDGICKADMRIQEQVFGAQLEIASHLKRPVMLHCVKRWGRFLEILGSYDLRNRGFLVHSFGGSFEVMKRLLKMGAYFSFSAMLAHPSREKMRRLFREVPNDRVFLETDAPDQYCAQLAENSDASEGGVMSEPAHITRLYNFAAQLKKLDRDLFREIIWRNGQIFKN